MKDKLGSFGKFVKQYKNARRSYPSEVFIYLKKILPYKNPKILDLGCGTGISTRQLSKIGNVIGCDPDSRMLKVARAYKTEIKYMVGKAEKLPFKDKSFDVVTAFAAFHWFTNKTSLDEIRRVLKPEGLFFAVNQTGEKSWGQGYRKVIIKSVGQNVAPFITTNYKPWVVLKNSNFRKIKIKTWRKREEYTLSNILEYMQSVSIWITIPDALKTKALEGLKKYFLSMRAEQGKIERKFVVRAVAGFK